jgi:hypothetical protein
MRGSRPLKVIVDKQFVSSCNRKFKILNHSSVDHRLSHSRSRISIGLNPAEKAASVGNKCRLCGVDTAKIQRTIIFAGDEEQRELYSQKIFDCLSLQVCDFFFYKICCFLLLLVFYQVLAGDYLPKFMCAGCTYKLNLLCEFKKNAEATESSLLAAVFPAYHHNQVSYTALGGVL